MFNSISELLCKQNCLFGCDACSAQVLRKNGLQDNVCCSYFGPMPNCCCQTCVRQMNLLCCRKRCFNKSSERCQHSCSIPAPYNKSCPPPILRCCDHNDDCEVDIILCGRVRPYKAKDNCYCIECLKSACGNQNQPLTKETKSCGSLNNFCTCTTATSNTQLKKDMESICTCEEFNREEVKGITITISKKLCFKKKPHKAENFTNQILKSNLQQRKNRESCAFTETKNIKRKKDFSREIKLFNVTKSERSLVSHVVHKRPSSKRVVRQPVSLQNFETKIHVPYKRLIRGKYFKDLNQNNKPCMPKSSFVEPSPCATRKPIKHIPIRFFRCGSSFVNSDKLPKPISVKTKLENQVNILKPAKRMSLPTKQSLKLLSNTPRLESFPEKCEMCAHDTFVKPVSSKDSKLKNQNIKFTPSKSEKKYNNSVKIMTPKESNFTHQNYKPLWSNSKSKSSSVTFKINASNIPIKNVTSKSNVEYESVIRESANMPKMAEPETTDSEYYCTCDNSSINYQTNRDSDSKCSGTIPEVICPSCQRQSEYVTTYCSQRKVINSKEAYLRYSLMDVLSFSLNSVNNPPDQDFSCYTSKTFDDGDQRKKTSTYKYTKKSSDPCHITEKLSPVTQVNITAKVSNRNIGRGSSAATFFCSKRCNVCNCNRLHSTSDKMAIAPTKIVDSKSSSIFKKDFYNDSSLFRIDNSHLVCKQLLSSNSDSLGNISSCEKFIPRAAEELLTKENNEHFKTLLTDYIEKLSSRISSLSMALGSVETSECPLKPVYSVDNSQVYQSDSSCFRSESRDQEISSDVSVFKWINRGASSNDTTECSVLDQFDVVTVKSSDLMQMDLFQYKQSSLSSADIADCPLCGQQLRAEDEVSHFSAVSSFRPSSATLVGTPSILIGVNKSYPLINVKARVSDVFRKYVHNFSFNCIKDCNFCSDQSITNQSWTTVDDSQNGITTLESWSPTTTSFSSLNPSRNIVDVKLILEASSSNLSRIPSGRLLKVCDMLSSRSIRAADFIFRDQSNSFAHDSRNSSLTIKFKMVNDGSGITDGTTGTKLSSTFKNNDLPSLDRISYFSSENVCDSAPSDLDNTTPVLTEFENSEIALVITNYTDGFNTPVSDSNITDLGETSFSSYKTTDNSAKQSFLEDPPSKEEDANASKSISKSDNIRRDFDDNIDQSSQQIRELVNENNGQPLSSKPNSFIGCECKLDLNSLHSQQLLSHVINEFVRIVWSNSKDISSSMTRFCNVVLEYVPPEDRIKINDKNRDKETKSRERASECRAKIVDASCKVCDGLKKIENVIKLLISQRRSASAKFHYVSSTPVANDSDDWTDVDDDNNEYVEFQ